ncbi:unnamed protein product [Owenia fusiformis]|uniref:Cytosolic fatty-acid binding proteins domain-containing protein n=1 Tax=Owenia fusiformis TaxID=6347 RepID=A0A8S4N9A2_OWEFU|nr:unnamed protein product [Owenia fusiformis]
MTNQFNGSWKLDRSENFDAFLAANGAPWFARKMAAMASPVTTIVQDGDKFEITIVTTMWSQTDTFTVGEPYEKEHHKSGKKQKCLASWEGDTLVLKMDTVGDESDSQLISRRIENDEMIQEMTMVAKGVTCTRIFKKQS